MRARLLIHVQPGTKRSELVGYHGEALKIRIAAPPEDGRANAELIAVLSSMFRVPKSSITIVHGLSARRKVVEFTGLTQDQINAQVKEMLA